MAHSPRGGIDEETLDIRAIEVTGSNIGDAPILPDLLGQIGPDQEIGCVTADGAYDTRKCYDAIIARNAHPVIPPRKTPSLGSLTHPVQGKETKLYAPPSISAVPFGDT